MRLLVEHCTDILFITNVHGVITWANPALEQHVGAQAHAMRGRHAHDLVHVDDREALRAATGSLRRDAATFVTCRLQHHADAWRWHSVSLTNRLHDPAIGGLVWNARDTTVERLYAARPAHDALHDPLTLLPNRALLLELGEAAVARSLRSRSRLAMLLIDLDRFKVVNDSAGHAMGDLLLATVGRRLLGCIRTGDSIARIGGDEFAILLEHLHDPADALTIARRVLEAIRQPMMVGDTEIWSSASVGICTSSIPDDDTGVDATASTFSDLLRCAGIALHQAKANGGAGFIEYVDHMDAPWRQRLGLESDLQRAIARNEMRVAYQPEVDTTTGQIVSLEALVRWMHPLHGLLTPDRFIPIAEETGQIVALGDWVLQEACQTLLRWKQHHPDTPLRVSVNISTRQLEQPDFISRVEEILRRTGAAPGDVCLELTESCFVQDGGTPGTMLQELHALGVQLAIDDFGIGYSSLAYLTRLRAQVLKIDRSFIAAFGQGNGTEAIVGAIVSLAHALGMTVTAEGIETAEHHALVQVAGCDRSQGYHFSRPRPADEIDSMLISAPPWHTRRHIEQPSMVDTVRCTNRDLHEGPTP